LPSGIEMMFGVTSMETISGGVTVILVVSEIVPLVAVILAPPTETAVASPLAFILATPELVEDHVTEAVIFAVDESVYVPVAVYCCVLPLAIDMLTGETAIETSSFTVTVKVVLSFIAPCEAVIRVAPSETALANPAAFTVATAGFEEIHVTVAVISAVVASV